VIILRPKASAILVEDLPLSVLLPSDFDANGNLLTLNNIGTLHWHYNNTLNQITKTDKSNSTRLVAKYCCLLGVRGWLGYCLCHRRKFADKILG
jgi:hypothetical protein